MAIDYQNLRAWSIPDRRDTYSVDDCISYAKKIGMDADKHRFVEVTETELMSLHEGNMARYRLRPSEFEAWRQGWR